MKKYAIIRPAARRVDVSEFGSFEDATHFAGVVDKDFGTVWMPDSRLDRTGLSIVVWEFGLLQVNPKTKEKIYPQPMFALNHRLYAGNALLYSFNEGGETVSLLPTQKEIAREILWLPTQEDAEKAIKSGLVIRPVIAVNNKILSAWPNMILDFDVISFEGILSNVVKFPDEKTR